MSCHLARGVAVAVAVAAAAGCASAPKYIEADCPVYEGLGEVRVNPAGAPQRYLRFGAAFQVCPPDEGVTEIQRKRIELKHNMLSLLSSQTEQQLNDPLRAEKLREQLLFMVNEKVLKKGRAIDVYITAMELE